MISGVRRATEADADSVAETLADAFEDYPWTRWTVDAADHRRRLVGLQRLAVVELALPYGEVWVVGDGVGVISAAVWMSPGNDVPAEVMASVASASAVLQGELAGQAAAAENAVAHLQPTTPHYLLGAVGTRPTSQRRGLGEAVLRPVLERADAEGVDAYLETSTSSNVAFYERLGFRITGHVTVSPGGPDVWAMLRSPA